MWYCIDISRYTFREREKERERERERNKNIKYSSLFITERLNEW